MALLENLTHITVLALLDTLVVLLLIPWILQSKKEAASAIAWVLVVIFMPLLGALLFWVFGNNRLQRRRLHIKKSHRVRFQSAHPPTKAMARRGAQELAPPQQSIVDLAKLALAVDAFPVSWENHVDLYHETCKAFDALLGAVEQARHHIHLQFYIFRDDQTGRLLLDLLRRKAREGVEVRLLYDSYGSIFFRGQALRNLIDAGGQVVQFLPVNPLRSLIRINLRNHRKIVVVDGQVAFTGGMNIGDEYLGKSPRFGYWRDSFLRLEGPAVAGFQRIFIEDWDFSCNEALDDEAYFPQVPSRGTEVVQIVESGPDKELNTIREVYFAAILAARKRIWIASPYFVPDTGILDALRQARYRGVQVRLLCLLKPDHFLSFHASRYYWTEMLELGVEIYQYARGMMHSKILLMDDLWAMTGSANLDNRSLHLNFEAGIILYSPALVSELEGAFSQDMRHSIRLDAPTFARRSYFAHLAENACRLLSPIL